MSEKEKAKIAEMVKKISELPEAAQQRILDKADGVIIAMDMLADAKDKQKTDDG